MPDEAKHRGTGRKHKVNGREVYLVECSCGTYSTQPYAHPGYADRDFNAHKMAKEGTKWS